MAVVISLIGMQQFEDFALKDDRFIAESLHDTFLALHNPGQGWEHLNDFLIRRNFMHMHSAQDMALSMVLNNTRIVITDDEYKIRWISPAVRYSKQELTNRLRKGYGITLKTNNAVEGYLYVGAMISGEYSLNQNRFIQSILLAIIISFIGFAAVFYTVLRFSLMRMLRPLDALMQAAYGITQGNWATPLPDSEIYELNTLTKAFSSMRTHMVHYEDMRVKTFQDLTHELKTPITIIRAEIEAIQAGISACDDTALASIEDETERLNTRIDYILSSSKSRSAIEVISETVSLNYVVSQIQNRFYKLLNKKGIVLNIDASNDTLVVVDVEKIIQAFSNIINNAVVHGGRGLSKIVIKSFIDDERVNIVVSNDGIAIPEKLAPFIFQRLYQHTRDGGSGIGLYIAQNIIQIHGGQLNLLHNYDGDVSFNIELPIYRTGGVYENK